MKPSTHRLRINLYQILRGIRDLYEKYHNVILPDECWKRLWLPVQYIPCWSLPDKAIDLVDVTAAHLAAQHPAKPMFMQLNMIDKKTSRVLAKLRKQWYEAALECQASGIEELEKKIKTTPRG